MDTKEISGEDQKTVDNLVFQSLKTLSEHDYFFMEHLRGAVIYVAIRKCDLHEGDELIEMAIQQVIEKLPKIGYEAKKEGAQ